MATLNTDIRYIKGVGEARAKALLENQVIIVSGETGSDRKSVV